MAEEKKYPKVIAGAFIFNNQNELLLVKAPRWQGKYTNVGGKVEMGESIIDALAREVKEETGLHVFEPEFISIVDSLELEKRNNHGYQHLIFIDYKVKSATGDVIPNEEYTEYKWLPLEEWLEKDEAKFAPYIYEVLGKIKALEEKQDWEQKYKRALADYQNLLKQTVRDKEEFAKYANETLLYELLPVFDNLKLSLCHISDEVCKNGWAEGIKHIVKQFRDTLRNIGVEEIETQGKKFDPTAMEAVENEQTEEKEKDGLVARELKAGYKLNGKVITPARVVVYQLKISN